jgi:hypothetical protein
VAENNCLVHSGSQGNLLGRRAAKTLLRKELTATSIICWRRSSAACGGVLALVQVPLF